MTSEINYINLIRDRHSTRSYERHPLSDADRQQIREAIRTAVPLQDNHSLAWKLADRFPMGCSTMLYAESGDSAEELAEYGYQGEQIVLALQADGWGTCWYYQLRMPGSPCSIAVGKASGTGGMRSAFMSVMTRGESRKTLEKLMPGGIPGDIAPQVRTVLASARLSPSAINRQPWTFEVVSDSSIIIRSDATRFPDLGICLANATVTARQLAGTAAVLQIGPGEYTVSWEA